MCGVFGKSHMSMIRKIICHWFDATPTIFVLNNVTKIKFSLNILHSLLFKLFYANRFGFGISVRILMTLLRINFRCLWTFVSHGKYFFIGYCWSYFENFPFQMTSVAIIIMILCVCVSELNEIEQLRIRALCNSQNH